MTATSNQVWNFNNLSWRYSVGNGEGTNGLNFATAADPRLPVCVGNDAVCRANRRHADRRATTSRRPLHVQLVWPARESSVAITSGMEARMIEAEAQLRAQNTAGALATLNAARATVTGLTPLVDAGTDAARVNQLFRERAIWLFGRGYRVGDMRRLIRQYGRTRRAGLPDRRVAQGRQLRHRRELPGAAGRAEQPERPGRTDLHGSQRLTTGDSDERQTALRKQRRLLFSTHLPNAGRTRTSRASSAGCAVVRRDVRQRRLDEE